MKIHITILYIIFLALLASNVAYAEVIFEGFYAQKIKQVHSGYQITQLSFDKKSNQYTLKTYIYLKANKQQNVVMETSVTDAQWRPITYNKSIYAPKEIMSVDVSFQDGQATVTGYNLNEKLNKKIKVTPKVLLSSCLNYYFKDKIKQKTIALEVFRTLDLKLITDSATLGQLQKPYKGLNLFFAKFGKNNGGEIVTLFNKHGDDVYVKFAKIDFELESVNSLQLATKNLAYDKAQIQKFFQAEPKGLLNIYRKNDEKKHL